MRLVAFFYRYFRIRSKEKKKERTLTRVTNFQFHRIFGEGDPHSQISSDIAFVILVSWCNITHNSKERRLQQSTKANGEHVMEFPTTS